MGNVTQLKDKDGNKIYPVTSSDLVFDNNGVSVTDNINIKASKFYVDTELSKKSDKHTHPYKSDSYVPSWNEITGKPSVFNPSSHNHDSLYAIKSSEHIHNNKLILDNITQLKITEWNNKSNFSGSYNDLLDKPIIPVVDVTKSYVDTNLGNKVDKVDGKDLSANDYTTVEKNKLAGLNNYTLPNATSTTLGGVKVGSGLSVSSGVISVNTIDYNSLSNKPNSLPANGGNSDTLDGQHASYFATKSEVDAIRSELGNNKSALCGELTSLIGKL